MNKQSDFNSKGEVRKAPATRMNNLKTGWTIEPSEKGMTWEDAEPLFLRSRKLGIYGASKAVKPRTIVEYQWDLKKLFDFMRSRGLTHYNQVTETNVLEYVEYLQSKNWSKATQRKYLISLKAFLRWVERDPECKKEGMQSLVRVLPRIGKEVRRKFIPSPEQMDIFRRGFDRTVIWGCCCNQKMSY